MSPPKETEMYDEVIKLLQEGKAKEARHKLGELLRHHDQVQPQEETGDNGSPPPGP